MGTSASNGGPKGSPSLVPDWYSGESIPGSDKESNDNQSDEGSQENQPGAQIQTTGNWGNAKGALTRVSNGTGGSSTRNAGRKYVRSLGGRRAAVASAALGIRTGGLYANFITSLVNEGFQNTLDKLGLSGFVGKPAEEVCQAIANVLAPIGKTNDEAIARDALLSTIDALYTKLLESSGSLDALDGLSPEMLKETLIDYVSNYVFTKWMYELGSSIEKGNISEQEAINLESDVKALIYAETREKYRSVDVQDFNLDDESSLKLIHDIFDTAYSLLEN